MVFIVSIVFICLEQQKKKLEHFKNICENKDYCGVVPSKDSKILEFHQYQKSNKTLYYLHCKKYRNFT